MFNEHFDLDRLPLAALKVSLALSLLTLINYGMALPALVASLGGTVLVVGSVLSLAAFFRAVSRVFAGFLRDRLGDRPVLFLAAAMRGLAFTLLAFSQDVRQVALAAVLFSSSQGFESIALLSFTASQTVGSSATSTFFGLVLTVRMLPGTLSSVFTGFLAKTFGVKSVFAAGMLLSVAVLAALSKVEIRSSKHPSKIENAGRVLKFEYMILWLSTLFLFMAVTSFAPLLTLWVTRELGYDLAILGLVLFPQSLVALFSRVYSGYIADKLGSLKSLILVGLVRFAAFFLIPYASAPLLLAALVALRGSLMAGPPRNAYIASLFNRKSYGKAYGAVGVAQDMGGIVGPLASSLIAEVWGFKAAFHFMALCVAIYASLLLLLLKENKPTGLVR